MSKSVQIIRTKHVIQPQGDECRVEIRPPADLPPGRRAVLMNAQEEAIGPLHGPAAHMICFWRVEFVEP